MFIHRNIVIIIMMIVILVITTHSFISVGHEFWMKLHYLSMLQAYID